MALYQHEVSVRSRNQYSVVGDSGKVVQALQVNAGQAPGRRGAALGRRNPTRFGATGATDESLTGPSISTRTL